MRMLSVGYLSVDCLSLLKMAHRGCDRTLIRLFIINALVRFSFGQAVPKAVHDDSLARSGFLPLQSLAAVRSKVSYADKPAVRLSAVNVRNAVYSAALNEAGTRNSRAISETSALTGADLLLELTRATNVMLGGNGNRFSITSMSSVTCIPFNKAIPSPERTPD